MENLASAISWKLRELGVFDGADIQTKEGVLVVWEVKNGMKQPDDATLQQWCDDYEIFIAQKDTSDKTKAQQLQIKMNLSDDELETLKILLS